MNAGAFGQPADNQSGTIGSPSDPGDEYGYLDFTFRAHAYDPTPFYTYDPASPYNGSPPGASPGDAPGWWDMNHDGIVSDDEKDVDGDGLPNYVEAHGPLSGPQWWAQVKPWAKDGVYPLPYSGTNWLNRDTDGDGVLDGADDQDHDGYTNIEELSPLPQVSDKDQVDFVYVLPGLGMPASTHEFNPCLPNLRSPACLLHPTAGAEFAPFMEGSRQPTWYVWPHG